MRNREICPICGHGYLKLRVMEEIFVYPMKKGNKKVIIPGYKIKECDSCHEQIVTSESLHEVGKILQKLKESE